ncbi:RDD family protein [Salibacterium salarium]|uniref:RDD family protein n=2 Tax=Salibacterium salarium TaxID=284579 RepID=A0A428N3T7_9BACI|nr:RDD family protein [Salibacterium salarium]
MTTNVSDDNETESPTPSLRYAGFWTRFWAYIIDLVIVFSLNGLLLSPLWFTGGGHINVLEFFTLQGILSAVTSYAYFLLMTKWRGQTLGKMILGLKVVRKDAASPRWSDLFFREIIGRFIYRSLIFTNIIYIVVGFTDQKQGVHDIFGDTRVIHVEK